MQNEKMETADLLRLKSRQLQKAIGKRCGVTASLVSEMVAPAKRAAGLIHRAIKLLNDDPETMIDESVIYAESVFGHATRRGLVLISSGITFEKMLSPDEARHFAASLLQAATAAETDEILMTYFRDRIGIGDTAKLSEMLVDFRSMREFIREREQREAKEHGTENKI